MDKIIEKVVAALVIASICTASAAILKVNSIEVETTNMKELLLEVRQDVKSILIKGVK